MCSKLKDCRAVYGTISRHAETLPFLGLCTMFGKHFPNAGQCRTKGEGRGPWHDSEITSGSTIYCPASPSACNDKVREACFCFLKTCSTVFKGIFFNHNFIYLFFISASTGNRFPMDNKGEPVHNMCNDHCIIFSIIANILRTVF